MTMTFPPAPRITANMCRGMLLTLLALGQAGCGDPTSPVSERGMVGTYVLRTVGGKPLPYVLPNSNNFAIYGARFTLAADSTYTALDSAAVLGDTLRAVQRSAGRWRVERRGGKSGYTLWLRANSLTNGLALPFEFPYTIRDGGRTLTVNTTLTGGPIDEEVYRRAE